MKYLIALLILSAHLVIGAGVPLYSVTQSNVIEGTNFYVISVSSDGTNIVRVRFDQFTLSNSFHSVTGNIYTLIESNAALTVATSNQIQTILDAIGGTNAWLVSVLPWMTNEISLLQIRNDSADAGLSYFTNLTTLTNQFVATNDAAISNLTVNFDGPANVVIYMTNNFTLTNFSGITENRRGRVSLEVIPQLESRTNQLPDFGSASFGAAFFTNANSPHWSQLTQDVRYVINFDAVGTNVFVEFRLK